MQGARITLSHKGGTVERTWMRVGVGVWGGAPNACPACNRHNERKHKRSAVLCTMGMTHHPEGLQQVAPGTTQWQPASLVWATTI